MYLSPQTRKALELPGEQLSLTFFARPSASGHRQREAGTVLPTHRPVRIVTQRSRRLLRNRYELGALLGSGGMASVYAAIDRRIGRPVAIKIFHKEVAESAFINDIIRSNRTVAGLSHPFIASVFDVDLEDERPFVVMELVEGQSLAELTEMHGVAGPARGLPWSDVVRIVRPICAALAYLQSRNLMHGDLKPSNIVLTCPQSLKLIDLDLCILGGRDPSMRRVGTFPWMSPEQTLYGMRDIVSEIFTVGVLLYQLTTGELPFGGSAEDVVYKVSYLEYDRPRSSTPSMPAEIEQIILTAMEIRHRRYTCIPALIQALDASISNPAVAAWQRPRDVRSHQGRTSPAPVLTLTHLSCTSLGRGPRRQNAVEYMHQMLCSMFDREEFRRLIVLGFAGNRLLDHLDATQNRDGLVMTTIELLARRGLIDATFFHRVGEQRPLRWAEIQMLADSLNVGEELSELRTRE